MALEVGLCCNGEVTKEGGKNDSDGSKGLDEMDQRLSESVGGGNNTTRRERAHERSEWVGVDVRN